MSELVDALRSVMRPAQVDRGCESARLYAEIGNTELLNYVEEWRSEDDLKRSLRSGHLARLVAVMEIAAVPPTLKFSHVIDDDGLEFAASICRDIDRNH
jgi:quinol monooxygenase YgiN